MQRFAGFELDGRRAELRAPTGEVLKLRRKSFDLLQLLASNPGRVLSKDEIAATIWPNVIVGEDSLYQCVREVRTALGDDKRQIIKVVSGRGYLFGAEVTNDVTNHVTNHITIPGDEDSAGSTPSEVAIPPAGVTAVEADTALQQGKPQAAPHQGRRGFRLPAFRPAAAVAIVVAVCAAGFTLAAPRISSRIWPGKPVIAVTAIVVTSQDADVRLAAANLTGRLTDGLSGIPNIRVLSPVADHDFQLAAHDAAPPADFVLRGDLQRTEDAWHIQARMIRASTGEVQWSASHSVPTKDVDPAVLQSRLAAGVGYPVALKISAMVHAGRRSVDADVAVDQALASINRTSRENFATAQTMLEKALAANPDNVDLQATLAAHLMRGIMLVWYAPSESAEAGRRAKELFERASKSEPDYIPVLQAHCRFLITTQEFVDSLVVCAKALRFNPWDGLVMYHMGIARLQLARFDEALATFVQADRTDTPEISRWTWLLGAGLTCVLLDRNEEAVKWLQRSLAITQGSGRTHFMLAAAYQRLGRTQDAKEAIATGLRLRPGSTATNIALPRKNASPLFLAKAEDLRVVLRQAGMPGD